MPGTDRREPPGNSVHLDSKRRGISMRHAPHLVQKVRRRRRLLSPRSSPRSLISRRRRLLRPRRRRLLIPRRRRLLIPRMRATCCRRTVGTHTATIARTGALQQVSDQSVTRPCQRMRALTGGSFVSCLGVSWLEDTLTDSCFVGPNRCRQIRYLYVY